MEAVVQHFVDLTNVAFHNSEIDARVRLTHATEVSLPPGILGDNSAILAWLRTSELVADLSVTHGADLVGMAQPFLETAVENVELTVEKCRRTVRELEIAMFCAGAKDVAALQQVELLRRQLGGAQ